MVQICFHQDNDVKTQKQPPNDGEVFSWCLGIATNSSMCGGAASPTSPRIHVIDRGTDK